MKPIHPFLLSLVFFTISAQGQNSILIPDTIHRSDVALTLADSTHTFYSGHITNTMGVNSRVLGPTIILDQGTKVEMNVTNRLKDTTAIHWHGLHVSSEIDGGPHTFILPGQTWKPSFTVLDKAATYWYHPHLHHKTEEHVDKGISGFIIVRDKEESKIALPRTYGVDDFPLVIQTKDFDSNYQILTGTNSDDVVMVNATIDPILDVPAQVVRLRLLNGSSQRAFNFAFTHDLDFFQIASDGGLLEKPIKLSELLLVPGERAEVLLDLAGLKGQIVELKSNASSLSNGIYGAAQPGMSPMMTLNGYNPNPLNGSDFTVLKLSVQGPSSKPVQTIPTTLAKVNRLSASTADTTRSFLFSPASMGRNQLNGHFLINNQTFDMKRIDITIPFENTEIWEIRNQSAIAHPFHVHDVQFFILERNGLQPEKNEQGLKDVVLVKPQETVKLIMKFTDFANTAVPYMYHCHLLRHEDGGMMGQFVVKKTLGINPSPDVDGTRVYTDIYDGSIHIERLDEGPTAVTVLGVTGKVLRKEVPLRERRTCITGMPPGVLNLVFRQDGREYYRRVLSL